MHNSTDLSFRGLPGELQKRLLNIIGYGTGSRQNQEHYSCRNAFHLAIDEPLVNSSGKDIRLTCFQANEAYKNVLHQRTQNLNPAYIVYSDRRFRGRMHEFWLPVDPEQDIFFFHANFIRNQTLGLRDMHMGYKPAQWTLLDRAGQSHPACPAHIMLDVRSILRVAGECIATPSTFSTLGSAPDFLVALNCGVPAIIHNLTLAAWMTMLASLQIKPKLITVLVYTRLSDLFGDFAYADMHRISYPPPTIEEVQQLGLTQASRTQLIEVLYVWAKIMSDATAKRLPYPVLEFACTRR